MILAVIAAALVAGAAAQDRSNEVAIEGAASGDLELYPAAGQDVCIKYPASGKTSASKQCMKSLAADLKAAVADIVELKAAVAALTTRNPPTYKMKTPGIQTGDVEYVPLGLSNANQPFSVDLTFDGWGTGNGMSVDFTSDYMKISGDNGVDKVKAFTKENIRASDVYNNPRGLSFIFKHVLNDAGMETQLMMYYLKIDNFIVCGDNAGCKAAPAEGYQVTVRPRGGESYVPGSDPSAVDADVATNGALYGQATVVDLSPGGTTWKTTLTASKTDYDYVSLGSAHTSEPFSVQIAMLGWGQSHGLTVSFLADNFDASNNVAGGKNRVTAFMRENNVPGAFASGNYVSFIYAHAPGPKGNKQIQYYMKIHGDYFNCNGKQDCIDYKHSVKVTATTMGPSYVPGWSAVDEDVAALDAAGNTYNTAQMPVAGAASSWSTTVTAAKEDFDYVPLGLSSTVEPFSVQVGFQGWGTGHALTIDFLADAVPGVATPATALNKVTAFIQENQNGLIHSADQISVVWRNTGMLSQKGGQVIQYYLKVSGDYWNCDAQTTTAGKTNCEAAVHVVHVAVTAHGPGYTPGSSLRAVDEDVVANNAENKEIYFKANKALTTGDKSWKIMATKDKEDDDYLPLGISSYEEPFSVFITFVGWGGTHGMKVDIISDSFNADANVNGALNRVTAYVAENKDGLFPNRLDKLDFIFRHAPGVKNNQQVQYYLKVPGSYWNCDDKTWLNDAQSAACNNGNHFLRAVVVSNGPSYIPGSASDAIDSDIAANDASNVADITYGYASKAALANIANAVGGVAEWTSKATQTKADIDYYCLGRTHLMEPLSLNIGFQGWGSNHGIRVTVLPYAFATRGTVFVKEPLGIIAKRKAYRRFFTLRDPADINYSFIYMAVSPDYYLPNPTGCAAKANCEKSNHSVNIKATGEKRYTPGNSALGQDPDFTVVAGGDPVCDCGTNAECGAGGLRPLAGSWSKNYVEMDVRSITGE